MAAPLGFQLPFDSGSLIHQRYRVLQRITPGETGEVYQVHDPALGDHVLALKVYYPHLIGNDAVRKRIELEFIAARGVSHPNLLTLIDLNLAKAEYLYLVTEYVSGQSLEQRLMLGPLELGEAQYVTFLLLQALAEAHRQGLVHGSLRPSHILLPVQGPLKITNLTFGQTLQIEKLLANPVHTVVPHYMAPEQFAAPSSDPRTDLYAVGLIAFEMLVGERPFRNGAPEKIAESHLQQPLPRLADILPSVPPWFEQFISQCSAKDPNLRFPTAIEALLFLHRHMGEKPRNYLEQQFTVVTNLNLPRVRHGLIGRPRLLLAALLCAVLLLVSAVISVRNKVANVNESADSTAAKQTTSPVSAPPDKKTGIIDAAKRGDAGALPELIAAGTDINAADADSKTPLIHAAENGHLGVVRALLGAKANTEAADKGGRTAVIWATIGSFRDVLITLLEAGANVNAADLAGQTALFYAVRDRKMDLINLLLDRGALVNIYDRGGHTPFFFADNETMLRLSQRAISQAGPTRSKSDDRVDERTAPTPPPVDKTRLRAATPDGLFKYAGGAATLVSAKVSVQNTGQTAAQDVTVTLHAADNAPLRLIGPRTIAAGDKAEYKIERLQLYVPPNGKLSAKADCSNCYH